MWWQSLLKTKDGWLLVVNHIDRSLLAVLPIILSILTWVDTATDVVGDYFDWFGSLAL